jgi:hypothetical protein
MTVWFDGTSDIGCSIDQAKEPLDDLGELFAGVVGLMPGLTSIELVEKGPESVTIRTNEGLMTRTNIAKRFEAESVAVDCDE